MFTVDVRAALAYIDAGTRTLSTKQGGAVRMVLGEKDFIGEWRISEMEMWDHDALDLVAPATLSLGKDHDGKMSFNAIEVWIDYRVARRDGFPAVEFSFQGHDEGDEVSGRAWAILDGGQLRGRLFFHMGDESSFVATRAPGPSKAVKGHG
jgi:hypothetical protein